MAVLELDLDGVVGVGLVPAVQVLAHVVGVAGVGVGLRCGAVLVTGSGRRKFLEGRAEVAGHLVVPVRQPRFLDEDVFLGDAGEPVVLDDGIELLVFVHVRGALAVVEDAGALLPPVDVELLVLADDDLLGLLLDVVEGVVAPEGHHELEAHNAEHEQDADEPQDELIRFHCCLHGQKRAGSPSIATI